MSTSFCCRALLCCAFATLVATVVSFHAPTANVTPNNARSASGSSCATAASRCRLNGNNNSGNNSGSARQRRAAAAATTTPALRDDSAATAPQRRRGAGIFELNAGGGAGGGEGGFYTPADLEAYSEPWGITLHYRSTLNTYRIEAHRANGEVAGYTTGFYLGDLLHLDKVQIQRKESAYEPGAPNAPAPGTRDLPWAAKTGNLFQLGAVLGCAAVRYGYDRGARKVELLAIRENERQHSRLVRYYRIAGFQAEREVGEDLGSLRDRLTWGAEGTLMTASAEEFMRRWTALMLDTNKTGGEGLASDATAVEKQEA